MRHYLSLAVSKLRNFTKILSLKIRFGRRIAIKWDARIASTVIVRIAPDSKIIIGNRVELRENVILKAAAGGIIEIDDRVFMNDGCCLNAREYVHIGEDTMFGQGVKIYDHDHDYRSNDLKQNFIQEPVDIKENTWICSNVIVLRGCTIGAGSVVAAGTIVWKNVSPNVLFYTKKTVEERIIQRPIESNKYNDNV